MRLPLIFLSLFAPGEAVPDFLLDKAKELTQAYSYVRYPDVVKVSNLNKLAHDFIDYTRKLLKWVKQQI